MVIPLRMSGSGGAAFGKVALPPGERSGGERRVESSTPDLAARIGVPVGVTERVDVEAGYSYQYHAVADPGNNHGPFAGVGFRAWTSAPHKYEEGDVTWWTLDVRTSADLLIGDVGSGTEYGFGQTVSAGLEWVLLPGGKDLRGADLKDAAREKRQSRRGSVPLGLGVAVIGGHNRLHNEDYWTLGIGMTIRVATGLIPKFEGGLPVPVPFPLPISGGDVDRAPE